MTTPVLLPQMGLEVSEATVLAVLVKTGDRIAEGQPLLEVETDKATTDVAAPCDGYVVTLEVSEGDTVAVGAVLARIGDSPDEAAAPPPAGAGPDAAASDADGDTDPSPAPPEMADAALSTGSPPVGTGDRPADLPARRRAAPVARRAAAALGIELESVVGTGPRGRITLRDVEQAAANGGRDAPPENETVAATSDAAATPLEPLTKVRRVTAGRMSRSQAIPQYHLERDVDATHLLAQKEAIAAATRSGTRPGVTDLLIQAIAAMVIDHPALARAFVETPEPGLRPHASIGVGLAVASEQGLVVPVIPAADRLGLGEIAAKREALVDSARAGRLSLEHMSGAAITLSNLGGFGVDRFAAMLNPGESAIVAVGRLVDRVVPRGRGISVVPMLTVTMTFDHRAVDGAVGGAALGGLAELLEGRMAWRP